jgi:hypothetical protein
MAYSSWTTRDEERKDGVRHIDPRELVPGGTVTLPRKSHESKAVSVMASVNIIRSSYFSNEDTDEEKERARLTSNNQVLVCGAKRQACTHTNPRGEISVSQVCVDLSELGPRHNKMVSSRNNFHHHQKQNKAFRGSRDSLVGSYDL